MEKRSKDFIIIILICFFIYLVTLMPGVSSDDSGELNAAVCTLGIAHPPGYPTFILLGRLFHALPISNPAYRLNLLSALFGALTAGLVYLIVEHLTRKRIPGYFSAILIATAPTFWSVSIVTEVYTLNSFFLCLLIYLELMFLKKRNVSYIYGLFLTAGLALTNHISIIIFYPALTLLFLLGRARAGKDIRTKDIVICVLLFFAGLLPYLYLPLRSSVDPALDWGNPETIRQFLFMVTGEQYQQYLIKPSMMIASDAFIYLLMQFNFLLWFALVGGYYLWKRKRRFFISMILILLANFLFNIRYDISDVIIYFIPSYIVFAILIGLGLDQSLDYILRSLNIRKIEIFKTVLFLVIFLILVAGISYPTLMKPYFSKNRLIPEQAKNLSIMFEENSIVFTESENVYFPLLYMKYCEHYRKDLVLIHLPLVPTEWYMQNLRNDYPGVDLEVYNTFYDRKSRLYRDNIEETKTYVLENNPGRPAYLISGVRTNTVDYKDMTLRLR